MWSCSSHFHQPEAKAQIRGIDSPLYDDNVYVCRWALYLLISYILTNRLIFRFDSRNGITKWWWLPLDTNAERLYTRKHEVSLEKGFWYRFHVEGFLSGHRQWVCYIVFVCSVSFRIPVVRHTVTAGRLMDHSLLLQWILQVTTCHRYSCPSVGKFCPFAFVVLTRLPASSLLHLPSYKLPVHQMERRQTDMHKSNAYVP